MILQTCTLPTHVISYFCPTTEQFRCFAWSNSETQIVYVAERRHSPKQHFFSQEEFTEGQEVNKETHRVFPFFLFIQITELCQVSYSLRGY